MPRNIRFLSYRAHYLYTASARPRHRLFLRLVISVIIQIMNGYEWNVAELNGNSAIFQRMKYYATFVQYCSNLFISSNHKI